MIETDRLILRFHTMEDAPSMLELNRDPEVIRFTGDVFNNTIAEAADLIRERLLKQEQLYKMGRFACLLKDGTYVGWCGLRFFPEDGEVDLGYRFMRKYWGKGFASESSKASLKYGFETLKLKRIIAKAMPENIASIKVMQKLGMTFRGVGRDPKDPHTFVLYDMTEKEFQACAH
jgi:ribosomal-protein-alanine N-acetyltransferase